MFSAIKIIVPLDGTPESEKYLPFLRDLVDRWKGELVLVRVVDPVNFSAAPAGVAVQSLEEAREEAERYLLEKALALPGIRVTTACRQGPTSQVICQLAEPCDLVAFAPRGHRGLKRWIFGSVAEHVLRDASCPVLLLRGETNIRLHHLLLPMDGSKASLEVCRRSQDFVPPGLRVTLLHCHEAPSLDDSWCKTLESLTEGKERWQLVCHPGKAPATIKDQAMGSDCDLIAMATRGRTGWEHFWHGSVTEQVAREAPCPLLVFPPASLHCDQPTSNSEATRS